jgi:predicted dehydrogenase
MSEALRGGIVGCGFFGQIQLEGWGRMKEADIVAACDLDLQRAKQSAPSGYTSALEMIETESLDFLDIATRPDSHLPLVRMAADHKLPVICQKPMAPDWDDAIAMVKAAEAAGIPLMIHENWRWQPWFREARRIIARGDIGTPVAYGFQIRQRDGAGPKPFPNQPYFAEMPKLLIYEAMVHQIDTARFLFGDISTVFAKARRINPDIAGEDQATVVLTHENGLQGFVDGNRHSAPVPSGPAMGPTRIDGSEATLLIPATGDIFLDERKVWSAPPEVGYKGDSVRTTQVHFIECLRSGASFVSGAREYLKTFGVVEAAYDSLSAGALAQVKRWE